MLSNPKFKVINVFRLTPDTVRVWVEIDAKFWHSAKKRRDLGHLYGVDISNQVFREYGVKAYNPTVNDRRHAVRGVKRISFDYSDSAWTKPSATPNESNDAAPIDNAPIDNVIRVDFINKRRIEAA